MVGGAEGAARPARVNAADSAAQSRACSFDVADSGCANPGGHSVAPKTVSWRCTKRGGRPLRRLGGGNNRGSEDLSASGVHQVGEPIA